MPPHNELGQPVGAPLPGWQPPPAPPREGLVGRYCALEPIDPERHAEALFATFQADAEGRMWTYLPYGPFGDVAGFRAWMGDRCLGADPLFFAIVDRPSGAPLGMAAYLRIDRPNGVIEVGHLLFSPALQRTRAATEAMVLMMQRAFALGYRRYEWKCDALNAPSRAAAERLGFCHEGVFRQAVVVKGRNRDTAWYSILDREWPSLRGAYEQWLDPKNFDDAGRQRTSLSALTATAVRPQR